MHNAILRGLDRATALDRLRSITIAVDWGGDSEGRGTAGRDGEQGPRAWPEGRAATRSPQGH